jgi:hypothetical protein
VQLVKLSSTPDVAEKKIAVANSELLQARTVKFPALVSGKASAQFALVFDTSSKPERAEWLEGDESLRPVADKQGKGISREVPRRFLGEDYPPGNSFLRRLGLRARAAAARRAAVQPLIRD